MATVKMSDVKSGSENVKSIFRLAMSNRTIKFLETLTLTNDELLEIIDICQSIEKNTFTPEFYRALILTQKDFNNAVFMGFLPYINKSEAFENLLRKSKDITNVSKKRFIDYSMGELATWSFRKFFSQPISKELGIDVTIKPFNLVYVSTLISHIDRIFNVAVFTLPDEMIDEIDRIFATLSATDIHTGYLETISKIKTDRLIQIITRTKNTPESVIEYTLNKFKGSKEIQYKLVKHEKCPSSIKLDYYEKTGDDSVFSQTAKDVFLF